MTPTIPFDIFQLILDTIDDKHYLAQCCLAAKIMLDIARPRLYRGIEICLCQQETDDDWYGEGEDAYHVYFEILKKSALLLSTLEQSKHLQAYVQDLRLAGETGDYPKGEYCWLDEDPEEVYESIIGLLPNVKTISLIDPVKITELDAKVARVQQNRSPPLVLHLTSTAFGSHLSAPLVGSYTSLRTDEGSITLNQNFCGIFPSIRSLVLDCYKRMDGFSLSHFSSLDRLEFTVVGRHDMWAGTGPVNLGAVYSSLQTLTTLKTVVLSGFECPRLKQITSPTGVLKYLPASVTVLLIQVDLETEYLAEMVRHLPQSSGVKTVKLANDLEQGEWDMIEVECLKKGINLALELVQEEDD